LGPKGPESKRNGSQFAGLVQEHGKALVAVMAGLVPAIHVLLCCDCPTKTWMPGTRLRRGFDGPHQSRPPKL
jgi:sorbitol-specific phosphotransferase system component IIC